MQTQTDTRPLVEMIPIPDYVVLPDGPELVRLLTKHRQVPDSGQYQGLQFRARGHDGSQECACAIGVLALEATKGEAAAERGYYGGSIRKVYARLAAKVLGLRGLSGYNRLQQYEKGVIHAQSHHRFRSGAPSPRKSAAFQIGYAAWNHVLDAWRDHPWPVN